ncbi:nuclease-related domain-containing protein [Rhizobium halophilum]|uniref:nuclease-related domain-containing protein n=1 Tax=Rhizobium halophilum TaxID=2846852 RepID=UPI001EFC6600|nr:nuclease-related domain-containing protein [Rhizobium halophilum]MCF6368638.1 NERD domain-containing protein [Rhizobium halophilum]
MTDTSLRSMDAIFEDLRSLAQSEGALHDLSEIIYRDWVLNVDLHEGKVTDAPSERWSSDKLNTNELLLLLGLLVQAPDDRTYATVEVGSGFASKADGLLRELHDRINADAAAVFDPKSRKFLEKREALGMFAREAIYYGAASFYIHQFAKFARHRFRADGTWLLQNAGISIRPMIEIATFIASQITAQMDATGRARAAAEELNKGDLTSSLLLPKAMLRKKFGFKVDKFIAKFATPIQGANPDFCTPFSVNAAFIAPLIDLGDHLYVPSQYRLMESIYESPFYWMVGDKAYCDKAAANRGVFLEETAAHVMRKVFGEENVFLNARFPDAAGHKGEEIDVLVRYGEFVLVVQAKSKRITLKARAGDPEALRMDFKGAIKDPFEQALASGELIKACAKCVDADGAIIRLPKLPRVFPIVLLSDMFPAATNLSRSMLDRKEGDPAPVIWDIGFLDCASRLLPSPIEMLFYLKARGDGFDCIVSDSEHNYLGYHIRAKLALPPEVGLMVIERDFATVVDDYMISADLGLEPMRPKGVLETIAVPVIAELLSELRNAPPEIAAVVIELYEFSGAALEEVGSNIAMLRNEVAKTRKPIKAFSLPTASGGLTYAVTLDASERSHAAAAAIGRKHKYETKSDRWYVIVDSISTEGPIDGLLPLVWPWVEDADEADRAAQVARMFRSQREEILIGATKPQHD